MSPRTISKCETWANLKGHEVNPSKLQAGAGGHSGEQKQRGVSQKCDSEGLSGFQEGAFSSVKWRFNH